MRPRSCDCLSEGRWKRRGITCSELRQKELGVGEQKGDSWDEWVGARYGLVVDCLVIGCLGILGHWVQAKILHDVF